MTCEAGCLDCCAGYAPAMSKWEWEQINHPGKVVTHALTNCPFMTDSGCAVYARRPLICRLYAIVAQSELAEKGIAETLTLACPKGYTPEPPLPVATALEMLVMWQRLISRQFVAHLQSWELYCIIHGTSPKEIPDKFQWLRYMMATQEGRRSVCKDILNMSSMPDGKGSWVSIPSRMSIDEVDRLKNVLQSS